MVGGGICLEGYVRYGGGECALIAVGDHCMGAERPWPVGLRKRLHRVAEVREDVGGVDGVHDRVGAGEVGVAGEGFAGLPVDEEADLFDTGLVGVKGGDDGAKGEVFGFDAGRDADRQRPW